LIINGVADVAPFSTSTTISFASGCYTSAALHFEVDTFDSNRSIEYSTLGMSTIINATEVTVRYNERAILDAATLAIDEGQRIGLVGRNGCGKTTFLRILASLQAPDTGEVTRRRDLVVSYLSQDFMLDPALDVRGNVRAGAQHVLDLIAEFESLPADSKRHEDLEQRIHTLAG
jgi:ATPase subunit of ABC transporter with duplicated ATPase domains